MCPLPVSAVTDGAGGFENLNVTWGVAIADIAGNTYAVVAAYYDDGIQIINITDPYGPKPAGSAADGAGGFESLNGAWGVAIADIAGNAYAVVAAYYDDGIQIINITDPHDPKPAGSAADGAGGFESLNGANGVAIADIAGNTYAVVAAHYDDGIQIINITDPHDPKPAGSAADGAGGFESLNGANGVAIADIAGNTYAVAAAVYDDSIQIINITDPYDPKPAGSAADGAGGFESLGGAFGVAIADIAGNAYAVVAAYDDDSIQIINITDPHDPKPAGSAADGAGGFESLNGANGVAIADIAGNTYAVAAAYYDDSIQIINITDPYDPKPAGSAADGAGGFEALNGASGVAIADIAGNAYAVITTQYDSIQIIRLDIVRSEDVGPSATGAISP